MASRTVWLRVGAAMPRPYSGPLNVQPHKLIDDLSKEDAFKSVINAVSAIEWAVHVLASKHELPSRDNEVDFAANVSERVGGGGDDVFIAVCRVPNAAGAPAAIPPPAASTGENLAANLSPCLFLNPRVHHLCACGPCLPCA